MIEWEGNYTHLGLVWNIGILYDLHKNFTCISLISPEKRINREKNLMFQIGPEHFGQFLEKK